MSRSGVYFCVGAPLGRAGGLTSSIGRDLSIDHLDGGHVITEEFGRGTLFVAQLKKKQFEGNGCILR